MTITYPLRGLEDRRELFIIYRESCEHGNPPRWMVDAVNEEIGQKKEEVV